MIHLTKKMSYDLAEDSYRVFLRDAFLLDQPGRVGQILRMVYQVTSKTHPRIIYLASKNYSLTDTKKLTNDLESWLGDELDKLVDENGALSIEKIKTLTGREADIEVVLIDNDRDTEFRFVQRILPPGTLVDDGRLHAAA